MAEEKKKRQQRRKPKIDYNNPNTRALTSKTTLGKIAEAFGLKEGLSKKQLKTKLATMSQKIVKQGLKKAALGGGGVALLASEIAASIIGPDLTREKIGTTQGRNKPRTSKTTKTLLSKPMLRPKARPSNTVTKPLRPKARPSNTVTKSLRPKARPKK